MRKEVFDITNMRDKQKSDIIKLILNNHTGNGGNNVLKARGNEDLVKFIMQQTSYFDSNHEYSFVNFTTRCFMVINDLSEKDFPRCEYCGKIIHANAISMRKGFPYKTCSRKCAALNPNRRKKIEKTNLKLGRHPHWSNWEKSKETQKNKSQEKKNEEQRKKMASWNKHSSENLEFFIRRSMRAKATKVANGHDEKWNNHEKASQTKKKNAKQNTEYWSEIRYKAQQTNIRNGHDKNWNNSDKAKKTLKNHVEENPNFWMDVEQKRKKTKVDNGYDKNWNNIKKRQQTCLERYGVESYLKTDEFAEKSKKTCMELFGVEFGFQSKEIQMRSKATKSKKLYDIMTSDKNEVEPLFTFDEFVDRSKSTVFKWRCKKCGSQFESPMNIEYSRENENRAFSRCLKCYPLNVESGYQHEVYDFIAQLVGKDAFIYNDSKVIHPGNIDIYIPSMKIGFDYYGIYQHSAYTGTNSEAAREKSMICRNVGVKLFRIYEDDWKMKNEIVKSDIEKILGKCLYKANMKSCKVEKCTYEEAKDFHRKNSLYELEHFTKFNACLKDASGDVVAVMSVNLNYGTLLVCRYSTALQTFVHSNCLIKLLNFIVNIAKVSNGVIARMKLPIDWNDNKILIKNGFSEVKTTRANDHIVDMNLWSRNGKNLRSRDIKEKFKSRVEKCSLIQFLHKNQMTLIYDAGNAVYEKSL